MRLQTVAYEMGRGPWHSCAHHQKEVGAAKELRRMTDAGDSLFQHYLPSICKEKGLDPLSVDAEQVLQDSWDAPWLRTLGPRAAETRWWSQYKSHEFWKGHISERLFVLAYLGLQCGWFVKKSKGEYSF